MLKFVVKKELCQTQNTDYNFCTIKQKKFRVARSTALYTSKLLNVHDTKSKLKLNSRENSLNHLIAILAIHE